MSEPPDHDQVRDLVNRMMALQRDSEQLDRLSRESRLIRERIASLRREGSEFPDARDPSLLFDGLSPPPQPSASGPHDEGVRGDQ